MRIFFAGTPDCAVAALNAVAKRHTLAGVLTAPPARAGRGKKYTESSIAQAVADLKAAGTIESDMPVFTPEKLDAAFRTAVAALQPDVLVCFAYGKIFGPKTLALFPKGALNLHPSLLPRWRGPIPVPAAILAGDTVTGVTVQYMAKEMDAGDIVLQKEMPIAPSDTAETLLSRCAELGAVLISDALAAVETGHAAGIPQDHSAATYCTLLEKDSGALCWQQSAAEIDRKIRAYTPWPGAFTQWRGTKLALLQAHPYTGSVAEPPNADIGAVVGSDKQEGILIKTGQGILAVQTLQRETKKAMDWKAFLNGAPDFIGQTLQ